MMKPYFIITLLLAIFSSCSSDNIGDKNKRNNNWAWWVDDETGKGSWIPVTNNNSTVENGKYTLFYFNGNVAEKGRMKSKKKIDTTFYFDLSGDPLSYSLNDHDTNNMYYYKDGASKFYYYDGKLNGEGIVKEHRQGDKWFIYYRNGLVKYSAELENGVGFVKRFFENGKPQSIEYWNDSTHIYWVIKEWYENGSIKTSGEIQNGNLNGIFHSYYKTGKLNRRFHYKNGKIEGKFQEFFESGKLHQEENYINGERNGKLESWYENGNLKIVGTMKNNKKDGLWTAFDEEGKLMSTCEMRMGLVNGKLERYDSTGKIISTKFYQNMSPDQIRIEHYER